MLLSLAVFITVSKILTYLFPSVFNLSCLSVMRASLLWMQNKSAYLTLNCCLSSFKMLYILVKKDIYFVRKSLHAWKRIWFISTIGLFPNSWGKNLDTLNTRQQQSKLRNLFCEMKLQKYNGIFLDIFPDTTILFCEWIEKPSWLGGWIDIILRLVNSKIAHLWHCR